MEILWSRGESTADEVRKALGPRHKLTDSTVRTILRRLEAKQHATHHAVGKRFVYDALLRRPGAAAAAARRIVETICGGKATALIVGLLETDMLSHDELDALRARLDELPETSHD